MPHRRALFRLLTPSIVVPGLVLMLVGTLSAHDFWLVPNAFEIAAGADVTVLGQTSSRFPTTESAVTPDRIADARVLGPSHDARITDLSIAGRSLRLRARPAAPGQYVVGAMLHWRTLRESAEGFRRYLAAEGAAAALEQIDRERLLAGRDSVTRRYAKYAKTLVQVGAGGSRAFHRPFGHPLEFVPDTDPAAARAGDTLIVRLTFHGRPAAGIRVHAGAVEWSTPLPEEPRETARDVELVSDAAGRVRVPLTAAGLWNVRTLHITPSPRQSGADWDAHWATLVFLVAGRGAAADARRSDSLDVVDVVNAYDRALREADSAAALALLAPDAVILESGGVESREQYRAHHLAADMAFARAVPSESGPISVRVRGDVAWAWSTSTSQGDFRGRRISSTGAELMVLTRTARGWTISAIHWSSRPRG